MKRKEAIYAVCVVEVDEAYDVVKMDPETGFATEVYRYDERGCECPDYRCRVLSGEKRNCKHELVLFMHQRNEEMEKTKDSDLNRATLTGNVTLESSWPDDDWRSTYFVPENLKSSVEHADALRPIIPEGLTMPEMALRFILNESRVQTIIPGMRKANHVRMNIAASDSGPLPADLHRILKTHRWDRTPTEWSQ